MKKMSTTAKVLNVFAKIFMIMSVVGGIILAVAAVAMIFVDPELLRGSTTEMILGNVSFTLAPEVSINADAIKWHAFGVLVFGMIVMFFGAYYAKIIRKALEPVAEQNPFDEAVYRNIRKLGILTIVFGAVMQLFNAAIEMAIALCYDLEKIFISENITAMEFEFEFDGTFIIVAIVLFMLSGVFKYGAELQTQSDETL